MINKQKIFDDLESERKKRGLGFIDIEKIFIRNGFNYRGIGTLTTKKHPHLIYWYGWNPEAIDLLEEYREKYNLVLVPTSPFFYFMMGKSLKMPIIDLFNGKKYTFEKIVNYKRDHWLPCEFKKAS